MGGAELRIMGPGLVQAKLAVDGETHLRGVIVVLAVFRPSLTPARRTLSFLCRP
jgi:hypothetical protein